MKNDGTILCQYLDIDQRHEQSDKPRCRKPATHADQLAIDVDEEPRFMCAQHAKAVAKLFYVDEGIESHIVLLKDADL